MDGKRPRRRVNARDGLALTGGDRCSCTHDDFIRLAAGVHCSRRRLAVARSAHMASGWGRASHVCRPLTVPCPLRAAVSALTEDQAHASPSATHGSSPSAPHASPSAPHASPSAPHASPSAPHASPSAPHASPSAPHASPSATHASPSAPHASPSAPCCATPLTWRGRRRRWRWGRSRREGPVCVQANHHHHDHVGRRPNKAQVQIWRLETFGN